MLQMMSIQQWQCIKNFAALLGLILSLSLIKGLLLPLMFLMLYRHHQIYISELTSNSNLKGLYLYYPGIGVNQTRTVLQFMDGLFV